MPMHTFEAGPEEGWETVSVEYDHDRTYFEAIVRGSDEEGEPQKLVFANLIDITSLISALAGTIHLFHHGEIPGITDQE